MYFRLLLMPFSWGFHPHVKKLAEMFELIFEMIQLGNMSPSKRVIIVLNGTVRCSAPPPRPFLPVLMLCITASSIDLAAEVRRRVASPRITSSVGRR